MDNAFEIVLLKIAREAIEHASDGIEMPCASLLSIPTDSDLRSPRGAFVSLHTKDGAVRGCVGTTAAIRPLCDVIVDMARAAALRDPRFTPVRRDEVDELHVEISILHPPERVASLTEVQIGRDGLLVIGRGHRGLLLPQVAEERDWDATTFARHTCMKAGLDEDAYNWHDVELFRFAADVISEPLRALSAPRPTSVG